MTQLAHKESFVLEEMIHESKNSVVYRGYYMGEPVIIKRLAGSASTPKSMARFRFEFETMSLFNSPNVPTPIAQFEIDGDSAHAYADIDGISIATVIETRRLTPIEVTKIAIGVAKALDCIHKINVIHKDVNPNNIVATGNFSNVQLIDFGISSRLGREHQVIENLGDIEGTIEFLSPEQTGRMNRSLDHRSDFFSLGSSLYQLVTGIKPFSGSDVAATVHLILASTPPSPNQVAPDTPVALCEIIMKLLQKDPEYRYQSAKGLLDDLEKVRRQIDGQEPSIAFELGESDFSGRFEVPDKIYGRKKEIENLLLSFERVSDNGNELLQVSGPSGIGKSALVAELRKPLLERRGFFISGKFDQFKRNIPLSAVSQALTNLVSQALKRDEQHITQLRQNLQTELGHVLSSLGEIVPNLAGLASPNPQIVQLERDAFLNNFQNIFRQFISIFAKREHPVVFFLDDLQWADNASLDVLTALTHQDGPRFLLVITAYRDNEVDPSHPYSLAIGQIRRSGGTVLQLAVGPMQPEAVTQLLVDTLKAPSHSLTSLSKLISHKTGGNAFFIKTFVRHLYEKGMFNYDESQRIWTWDEAAVQGLDLSLNVVELLLGKLSKLSKEIQKSLATAACVGAQFSIATLAKVTGKSILESSRAIWPLLEEGYLSTSQKDFKIVLSHDIASDDALDSGIKEAVIRFSHDRIQDAAHKLFTLEQRREAHLNIGRILRASLSDEETQTEIFDLVDHFGEAFELLTDNVERRDVAKLHKTASSQALKSGAFQSTIKYVQGTLALVGDDAWDSEYEILFESYMDLGWAQKSTGNFDLAITTAKKIVGVGRNNFDKARGYELLAAVYELNLAQRENVQAMLAGLALLGLKVDEHVSEPKLAVALALFRTVQLKGIVGFLSDERPVGDNPRWRLLMTIFFRGATSAFVSNQNLFVILVLKIVQMARKEDVPIDNPVYVMIISLLATGARSHNHALKLRDIANQHFKHQPFTPYASLLLFSESHWPLALTGVPNRELTDAASISYKRAIQDGDNGFAGFPAFMNLLSGLAGGSRFQELSEIEKGYRHFFTELNPRNFASPMYFSVAQLIRVLAGTSSSSDSMDDFDLKQDDLLAKARIFPGTHSMFKTMSGWIAFNAGNYRHAISFALTNPVQKALPGCNSAAMNTLILALSALRLTMEGKPIVRPRFLVRLIAEVCRLELRYWDRKFQNAGFSDLVGAEINRFSGNVKKSLSLYQKALERFAESQNYYWNVFTHETLGRYYKDLGLNLAASTHLKEAIDRSSQFGLVPNHTKLKEEFAKFLIQNLPAYGDKTASGTVSRTQTTNESKGLGARLDIESIVKASQTISGQIEIDDLVKDILHLTLENAGADSGCFITTDHGNFVIKATGRFDGAEFNGLIMNRLLSEDANNSVPERLVKFVTRSGEELLINQVEEDPEFRNDDYLQRSGTKALICMPIKIQGQIIGILYIENSLIADAFTVERVRTLRILASQGAISLKNAGFVQELRTSSQRIMDLKGQLEKILAGTKDMAASQSSSRAIGFALRTIVEEVDIFSTSSCSVILRDGERNTFIEFPFLERGRFTTIGDGLEGHDGEKWRKNEDLVGITALDSDKILVPIKWHNDVLGLMVFSHLGSNILTVEQIQFVETLVQSLGLSLKNIEHSDNLEGLVALRTEELNRALVSVTEKQAKIQVIFDNIKQGILTFKEDLEIEEEYSSYLKEIVCADDTGISRMDLLTLVFSHARLSADDLNRIKQTLTLSVGADEINWDLNEGALPHDIVAQFGSAEKILALDWRPLIQDGTVVKVMLTIRDITDQRSLEIKVAKNDELQKRKMSILAIMLNLDRGQLSDFLRDSLQRIASVEALVSQENIDDNSIFRDLHTVKGSSRALKFNVLANLAHEAETALNDLQINGTQVNRDLLNEQITLISEEIAHMSEIYNEVFGEHGNTESWNLYTFASLVFPTVLEGAKKEGLQVERFDIRDAVGHWSDSMRRNATMMLTHCINNALDHGYVLPKKRGHQVGQVNIEVNATIRPDRNLAITVLDRGAGIDYKAVEKLAQKNGIKLEPGKKFEEVLFEIGASTADVITMSSGRGVGLGAIRQTARNLGGDATIGTRDGGGTQFEIIIPLLS